MSASYVYPDRNITVVSINCANTTLSSTEYINNLNSNFSETFYRLLEADINGSNLYNIINRLDKNYKTDRFNPAYNPYLFETKSHPNGKIYNHIMINDFTNRWFYHFNHRTKYTNRMLYADTVKEFEKFIGEKKGSVPIPSFDIFEQYIVSDVKNIINSPYEFAELAEYAEFVDFFTQTLMGILQWDYLTFVASIESETDMIELFESVVISDQQKLEDLIGYIKLTNPDIVCLQEMIDTQLTPLENIGYKLFVKNTSELTCLLIKSEFVSNMGVSEADIKILSYPVDSTKLHDRIIGVQIGHYQFFSAHFSSKSAKDAKSDENYDTQLEKFTEFMLADLNGVIRIAGIDANRDIGPVCSDFIRVGFGISMPTTKKTRSYNQAQLKKANKPVCEVKDHIIITTNTPINAYVCSTYIETLDGVSYTKVDELPNLPMAKHYTDHFCLRANIEV